MLLLVLKLTLHDSSLKDENCFFSIVPEKVQRVHDQPPPRRQGLDQPTNKLPRLDRLVAGTTERTSFQYELGQLADFADVLRSCLVEPD